MAQNPPASQAASTGVRYGLLDGLLVFGLSAAGLAAHVALQAFLDRPNETVVRTIPDVLALWRGTSSAEAAAVGLILAPPVSLLVSLIRHRNAPPLPTRWLIGVSAALVMTGLGVGALLGRTEVAVATPFGVSWIKDGKPREYWSWGAATSVAAACVKDDGGFALNYDVTFPSGREAGLIQTTEKLGEHVSRLAIVDQRLRATAVPRFTRADAGCLERYGRDLAPTEQATLRGLLGR